MINANDDERKSRLRSQVLERMMNLGYNTFTTKPKQRRRAFSTVKWSGTFCLLLEVQARRLKGKQYQNYCL